MGIRIAPHPQYLHMALTAVATLITGKSTELKALINSGVLY
jgi:hypothetical protein